MSQASGLGPQPSGLGSGLRLQEVYQLALELYREGKTLSVKGELGDQFNRASLSVVLNLAEGSGKIGKDRLKYFRQAMGSLREVQACLDIIEHAQLQERADNVGKHLYKLLKNPGHGA